MARSTTTQLAAAVVVVATFVTVLLSTGCGLKGSDTPVAAGPPATAPDGSPAPTPAGPPPDQSTPSAPPATAVATTVDPATLPQTEDKPSADSAPFQRRVRAMWDGIVRNDPDAAMPFFFPLPAYRQVKALQNPENDWNSRLVSIYKSEIKALHQGLGADAKNAEFVGIDVPMANAQWIKPGVEYNKLGYWRVYGTKVRYKVAGKEKSFPVQSLISWRGEWFVVHLTAVPR